MGQAGARPLDLIMLGWRHSCGKGLVQSPCAADLDRDEDKAYTEKQIADC